MLKKYQIAVVAVFVSSCFLWFCNLIPMWGAWYSVDFTYQKQVERLLDGHLSISDSPAEIANNFAWGPGGVHQVWGLGVPVWKSVLDWGWKKSKGHFSPDRFSFIIFLLCSFSALLSFGNRLSKKVGITNFIGIGCIILVFCLSPPFLSLCLTPFTVYEEAEAYGFLICCVLLSLSMSNVIFTQHYLFLFGIAFLSGLSGFIRPTLLAYGLASILILCFRIKKNIVAGAIVLFFFIGITLLLYTNYIRFGYPLEFGHSLNINASSENIYASRFDYPFSSEPIYSALKELFGILFLNPHPSIISRDFESNLFWGQSSTFRWRNFYFSTFDLSYFFMTLVVWGWVIVRSMKRIMQKKIIENETPLEYIAMWSIFSGIPLVIFYVRFPFISSRYLLDFAPSFSASVLVFWLLLFRVLKKKSNVSLISSLVFSLVLAVWWGYEVKSIDSGSGHNSVTYEEAQIRLQNEKKLKNSVICLPNFYTSEYDFRSSGIFLNGNGWKKTGETMSCVCLFVENPKCLVLELSLKEKRKFRYVDYEPIQAKIGLEFLKRLFIVPTKKGAKIVFEGPKKELNKRGIQLAFIGMIRTKELKEGLSSFYLWKVRWGEGETDCKRIETTATFEQNTQPDTTSNKNKLTHLIYDEL